jgi:hypothetical protein
MTHRADHDVADADASAPPSSARGGAPGKSTLTSRLWRSARRDDRGVAPGAEDAVAQLGGGGAPLPGGVRDRFEASLGADLGAVRVHTDDASASAADAVGARAFARGNDIHFGAGQYQPDDPFGMHLLAHEVAHTVQQSGGAGAAPQYKLAVSAPGDAAEVEADRAADAMVAGQATSVGGSGQALMRDAKNAATAPATSPAKPDTYVAAVFVGEFEPILGSFKELPPKPSGKSIDPKLLLANWTEYYQQNQARAAWLEACAVKLKQLFSAAQLTRLTRFAEDHVIPEGLFTDTKVTDAPSPGTIMASTSLRTLIAAHILARGRTVETHSADSAAAPGKVHAANCGQWAEYVWIYAGVNSALGDPGGFQGTGKNSLGATGKTSFGAGGPNQSPFGNTSTKVTDAARKDADAQGVETMDSGGGKGRKDPLGAPDPEKMFAALAGLRPGDWVWVDNRADADGHSFIFASWETEPAKGSFIDTDGKAKPTARGVAYGYSQRANGDTAEARKKKYGDWAADGGGDRHTLPVGYPFSTSPQRYPVTQVSRPAANAGPARTEDDLLRYDRVAAAKKNTAMMVQHKVELGRYHALMVEAAAARLASATDYEPGLKSLCAKVAADRGSTADLANLTALIALTQRMSPTDKVLEPKKSGFNGRPVRGWLDLGVGSDLALVPGGLKRLRNQT